MSCNQYCILTDQDGRTALMDASMKGQSECLSILLAHGAEVDKANSVGLPSIIGCGAVSVAWFAVTRFEFVTLLLICLFVD